MPLTCGELLAARRAGPHARPAFVEACRAYHNSQAAFAVSSARAALWLALRALKTLSPKRRRVILPAYTCPTVGRAVLAAGLEGLCVDISPEDFHLDSEQVEAHLNENVVAVIAAHMFGTPCDLPRIADACRRSGAFLVEDAAQACGATYAGRRVATFGELAVLSLGRSKNLRGAGGGVLLVNRKDLIAPLTAAAADLPDSPRVSPGAVARQLAVSALSQPRLWDVVRRAPFLHIGAEDQAFDERPALLSSWQASLGTLALARVDGYNERRAHLGRVVERELTGVSGLHAQAKAPPRESAYVRLALRVDRARFPLPRDVIVGRLQAEGIDARAFYTRPIPEYNWWQRAPDQPPYPEARRLIDSNLVLPLYYGMSEADAVFIAQRLAQVCPPSSSPSS
jgi:dTDP-4-amino-4,6-dideoxygalactose transaminase